MLIISRLHDILILNFPVKINMDVPKIENEYGCAENRNFEYKNFKRILGEREILSKILGDFIRI